MEVVKNQLLQDEKVRWVYTLDLETTCQTDLRDRADLTMTQRDEIFQTEMQANEVTEIGALLCPKDMGAVFGRFDELVRPLEPRVTPFSLELCPHITLDKMKNAMPFPTVMNRLVKTILSIVEKDGDTLENVAFLQWGDFDWKQIRRECNRHNMAYPAFAGKVNVKNWFKKAHGQIKPGTKSKGGIDNALQMLGQKFQGVPHGAYADAYNTWRVYRALRVQGKV